jgi:hypothetical protein
MRASRRSRAFPRMWLPAPDNRSGTAASAVATENAGAHWLLLKATSPIASAHIAATKATRTINRRRKPARHSSAVSFATGPTLNGDASVWRFRNSDVGRMGERPTTYRVETCCLVIGALRNQQREFLPTTVLRPGAARMESTSGRRVEWTGNVAL